MGALKYEAMKYNVGVIDVYFGAMNTDMTEGRKDRSKFIKTDEVADLLFQMCRDYSSMRINEMDIFRRVY
jgi:hypothetical protein